MIEFEIPGNPQALKRHRTFRKGNFTGQYDPSKGDKADFLAMTMANKPDKPLDEPLKVTISCFFPRPKSHFRTGKYSGELKEGMSEYHTKTPDADNLAKFVCDALNGIFWTDDKIVAQLIVNKYYSKSPRTRIWIEKLRD